MTIKKYIALIAAGFLGLSAIPAQSSAMTRVEARNTWMPGKTTAKTKALSHKKSSNKHSKLASSKKLGKSSKSSRHTTLAAKNHSSSKSVTRT
jgi:hypothetical protein